MAPVSAEAPQRSPVVNFDKVDIVFGDQPWRALPLIDAGKSRAEIVTETGQIVGVKGASLQVYEGEIVVLMGLSGSGKSTLLRAVNGLNGVARGKVSVYDGRDHVEVHRCSRRRLRELRRKRVSMVFQQFALLPWRTVAENVALGLELDGVPRKQREERVKTQLDLVGLSAWSDKRVHELSGGMQQRVGLARAFANDAPILLMDEPFSALDPLIRVRLQDELLELQRKLNRTIIFVSHDLDEALKIGSRIAIMEGGEIVQVGSPQEIVLNPSSEYVRDFVAHMNPLNVLRACEIMVPFGNLSLVPGTPNALVDDAVTISPSGEGRWNGEDMPTLALSALGEGPRRALVAVEAKAPLKLLIDARLRHSGPFVVRDGLQIAGIIRDEELFRCLIHARPMSEGSAPAVRH